MAIAPEKLADSMIDDESFLPYERVRVPELDAILGKPFRVLDDGFVRVVDYMGGDPSIVQAARVSYGAGTKKVREDRGLIRYLMRHRHTTPFEMCDIKFHVRVPMDTWRQWVRHRTASVNEYSTRYSVAIDAAQETPVDGWRAQSASNRQGSEGLVDPVIGERLSQRENQLLTLAREVYEERLDAGVAREQARKDLPLSTYTEAYWKTNLHNLMHFLGLRMDSHAQYEIREYAHTIGEKIVAKWVPTAWQAFLDYETEGVAFTEAELAIVRALTAGDAEAAIAAAKESGLLTGKDGILKPGREGRELTPKLERLGLTAPWA
ncbi:MAG: FAD-dependent thymidylate synthase [Thermomicrobiales bacterium]